MPLKSSENVRLIGLALLLLVGQLVWSYEFPLWRVLDWYAIFLLLLSSGRGALVGGVFALLGGAVLDSFSAQLPAFHMLFYLLPVGLGTALRSRMVLQYRELGTLAVAALLLAKVGLQLTGAMALGWIDSPVYLLRLNYLPLLLLCVGVYFAWPQLIRLVPPEGGRAHA